MNDSSKKQQGAGPGTVRVDKWLWAARFYKTRALATEAVNRGNIKLNHTRVKPARPVGINDVLDIRKGPYHWQVRVTDVTEKRGSAAIAALLYSETEASKKERETVREQLKIDRLSRPRQAGKPGKTERRKIMEIKKQI